MKKTSFKFLAELFCPTVRFCPIFSFSERYKFHKTLIMKRNLVEKNKKYLDLELTQTENFDFRFGVFWLTTSIQNTWLEIAAFYKRKLSRATHAAQLL